MAGEFVKGFILAAGFGKRMGDLTRATPKPLLPLHGVALILYTLFQLHRWKVTECWINTHYLADQIEEGLRHFPHFPLRFSREPEILGTAGGLRKPCREYVREPALVVINPDAIFLPTSDDNPSRAFQHFSTHDECDAFLFLGPRSPHSKERGWNQSDDGSLSYSETGAFFYLGCSLVRPASLEFLSADTFAELGPIWVEASKTKGRLIGRKFAGVHIDLGTKEAYLKAQSISIFTDSEKEEWGKFLEPMRTVPGHRLLFPKS